jgi:hypothetical protein
LAKGKEGAEGKGKGGGRESETPADLYGTW